MLPSRAKQVARAIRDRVLAARVLRGSSPPQGSLTVLTYHRVLPEPIAREQLVEPGMYVTPETFRRHVEIARRHFTPIRLKNWPRVRQDEQALRHRYLAITFDDGWRDNYDHAMNILVEEETPATVFVVTGAVEQELRFWSDRLAALYRDKKTRQKLALPDTIWTSKLDISASFFNEKPDQSRLSWLVNVTKGVADDEIEAQLDSIESAVQNPRDRTPSERLFMNWKEVQEMADTDLVDFGSHSASHVRLDGVTEPRQLEIEIAGSKQILSARVGDAFCDAFCYPNGDFGSESERSVRQNYTIACTVNRGRNSSTDDPFRIRRQSVHEDATNTQHGFLANMIRR